MAARRCASPWSRPRPGSFARACASRSPGRQSPSSARRPWRSRTRRGSSRSPPGPSARARGSASWRDPASRSRSALRTGATCPTPATTTSSSWTIDRPARCRRRSRHDSSRPCRAAAWASWRAAVRLRSARVAGTTRHSRRSSRSTRCRRRRSGIRRSRSSSSSTPPARWGATGSSWRRRSRASP